MCTGSTADGGERGIGSGYVWSIGQGLLMAALEKLKDIHLIIANVDEVILDGRLYRERRRKLK